MNLERIAESVRFLTGKGVTAPQIGIVLGTGLGNLVKEIKVEIEIPYEQIPYGHLILKYGFQSLHH